MKAVSYICAGTWELQPVKIQVAQNKKNERFLRDRIVVCIISKDGKRYSMVGLHNILLEIKVIYFL